MEKKTFNFIYSRWREDKRETVKESSFATYSLFAEKHLVPFFGDKTDFGERVVREFVTLKTNSGLSGGTLRNVLQVLHMIVKYGVRHDYTDCRGWFVKLPRSEKPYLPRVFSVVEQRKMMVFLRQNLTFRNLGLYICLCTGMRIGEICALRWDDIHLDERTISVCRTMQRIYSKNAIIGKTRLVIGHPKTENSMRDIPVNSDLARILRPLVHLSYGGNYVISNSLHPLEPRLYRRHFRLLLDRLDLPQLNFHALRHTFATRCVESNCDYKTISAILGHSSIATTMNLYVHPDIEQKRRCIDKMLRRIMY